MDAAQKINEVMMLHLKGEVDPHVLDLAFEAMANVSDGHKEIPDKDFGTVKREEIIEMIIDDLHNQVINGKPEDYLNPPH